MEMQGEGGSEVIHCAPVHHDECKHGPKSPEQLGRRGGFTWVPPLPKVVLEEMRKLHVGRLELPPLPLQAGHLISSSLSLSLIETQGPGGGGGAARSRNNLIYSSQM